VYQPTIHIWHVSVAVTLPETGPFFDKYKIMEWFAKKRRAIALLLIANDLCAET